MSFWPLHDPQTPNELLESGHCLSVVSVSLCGCVAVSVGGPDERAMGCLSPGTGLIPSALHPGTFSAGFRHGSG